MSEKKRKGFWRSIGRRDPSSRHSLIETSSQCSLDLPDDVKGSRRSMCEPTTGSLDRLTAVNSKPPRPGFFHLKPKTPAFWKPLFQNSTQVSTAPALHKNITLMKHQLVQTDSPTKATTSDCGVQAEHSTHTRDALVQTCPAWDDRSGRADVPSAVQSDPIQADCSGNAAVVHQLVPDTGGLERKPVKVTFVPDCVKYSIVEVEVEKGDPALCEDIQELQSDNSNSAAISEPTMSSCVSSSPVCNFQDPDWKLLCETFPEIQSNFIKSGAGVANTIPRELNSSYVNVSVSTSEVTGGNPLSSLRFDFDELRNDFGVLPDLSSDISTSRAIKIQNMVVDPNFNVLRDVSPLKIESHVDNSTPISMKNEESDKTEDQPLTSEKHCNDQAESVGNCGTTSPAVSVADEKEPRPSSAITDTDKSEKLSSCSSSARNSVISGMDSLIHKESMNFDSCENLEQLENEIIRSLCSPVKDLGDLDIAEPETDTVITEYRSHSLDINLTPQQNSNPVSQSPDHERDPVTTYAADNQKCRNKPAYDSTANKNWKMLTVPLENITEESATDDDSNSQKDYRIKVRENEKNTICRSEISADIGDHSIGIPNTPTHIHSDLEERTTSPGFVSVNEISEMLVELPPRKAKLCVNVLEISRKPGSISYQISSDNSQNNEIGALEDQSDEPQESSNSFNVSNRIRPDGPDSEPATSDNKAFDVIYATEQRDSSPEAKHVSQSFLILDGSHKEAEVVHLAPTDPPSLHHSNDLSLPPPPPPPPPPTGTKYNNSKISVNAHATSDNITINNNPLESGKPKHLDKPCSASSANNCSNPTSSKSPMVFELEQRFLTRQKMADDLEDITKQIAKNARKESEGLMTNKDVLRNGQSPDVQNFNRIQNGHNDLHNSLPQSKTSYSISSSHPSVLNGNRNHIVPENTVVTDQPPPPGAVLISEKVTVDGDQVHRDKYYAIPVKEVIKEKTSETKFIPAPAKYEGIGPTEEGIPLGLRQSVKKENMSDWYKTMYKTLHKIENEGDTYVIGYTSDPECKEKRTPRKLDILNDPPKHESPTNGNIIVHSVSPTSKSPCSFSTLPRPIADYEPGYSSVVDNQPSVGSKRYFPTVNQTKPSYEIKDGFEPDNYVLKRNLNIEPDEEQQRVWYRQVQKGGDIPQFGLGKLAPEKRQDPMVGPPPPPPTDYYPRVQSPKGVRPSTLPPDCSNAIDNGLSQQCNGFYANQMRQAIHNELQQKGYQISPSAKVNKRVSPEKRLLARVLYNFTAESPREISLKKDDIVLIHRELDKNWYEGEFNARIGIFPISYAEILPPEHVAPQHTETQEGLAKVMYDFNAHTAVELNARKGDEIHLLRKVDDNWFEGRLGSKKGIIPISYLSIIREPVSGMVVEKYQIMPQLSSPRSTEISRSSPVSPMSSTSLSSPSVTSGLTSPPHSETMSKTHVKKGSHLVEPILYKALYRYCPQNDDELEMIEGDSVYVVEMCDDGWFVGRSVRTGELGIIPGNYMEKVA